jgi:hypothetical protein
MPNDHQYKVYYSNNPREDRQVAPTSSGNNVTERFFSIALLASRKPVPFLIFLVFGI